MRRAFGEPRFHTDGDVAAVAFAADGSVWSIDEAGVLRHWAADGRQLARHFLSDLETLWAFSPDAGLLASGNDDLLLWDAAGGQLVRRIEQDSWVTAVATHYGVPRHTAQSWIRRLRNEGRLPAGR